MSSKDKAYLNKFEAVKKDLTAKQLKALYSVGIFLEGEMINRAPVGIYHDGRVGGNLRQSISYKVDAAKKTVYAGASALYAIYVEKGTGLYAEGGKGRKTPWKFIVNIITGETRWTRGQKPQPFIAPAGTKNVDRLKALILEAMK